MPRNCTARRFRSAMLSTLSVGVLAAVLTACGTPSPAVTPHGAGSPQSSPSAQAPVPRSTEVNPAGDIPDNQAYVTITAASGTCKLQVPEGWARTSAGSSTTFTDKLNFIAIEQASVGPKPTVESVRKADVPALASIEPKFLLGDVTTFTRNGASGVLITYLADSEPSPVTGKVIRDAVERYLFWKNGHQVAVTLTGPQGSDNVDPWAKVTGSFGWLL